MQVTSIFEEGTTIPTQFTCDGQDINPPLTIIGAPEKTKTYALIVDDPDAPMGTWDHWIVWNITNSEIEQDSVPGDVGVNSWGRNDWGGPCPPNGEHRYRFTVYALDSALTLEKDANKQDVLEAMKNHILATTTLIGVYER